MFRFGLNWKDYALHSLNQDKFEQAKQALGSLLQTNDLSDKTFLDIGCGSGLHTTSAAAFNADKVYALDIDQDCIDVTRQTISRFLGSPDNIQVSLASVLDPAAMEKLPRTDIVYSWGVLHHTGQMYRAIQAASELVKPGGLYVIAIYNKHVTSPLWRRIKWLYNQLPQFGRRLMYYLFYVVIYIAKFAATRQNPLNKERGMDFGYDVVDWIGGYPYEYASIDEIVNFVTNLGFRLERAIPAQVGTGCNEFVFQRMS